MEQEKKMLERLDSLFPALAQHFGHRPRRHQHGCKLNRIRNVGDGLVYLMAKKRPSLRPDQIDGALELEFQQIQGNDPPEVFRCVPAPELPRTIAVKAPTKASELSKKRYEKGLPSEAS